MKKRLLLIAAVVAIIAIAITAVTALAADPTPNPTVPPPIDGQTEGYGCYSSGNNSDGSAYCPGPNGNGNNTRGCGGMMGGWGSNSIY